MLTTGVRDTLAEEVMDAAGRRRRYAALRRQGFALSVDYRRNRAVGTRVVAGVRDVLVVRSDEAARAYQVEDRHFDQQNPEIVPPVQHLRWCRDGSFVFVVNEVLTTMPSARSFFPSVKPAATLATLPALAPVPEPTGPGAPAKRVGAGRLTGRRARLLSRALLAARCGRARRRSLIST